jgi:hypothetical protein
VSLTTKLAPAVRRRQATLALCLALAALALGLAEWRTQAFTAALGPLGGPHLAALKSAPAPAAPVVPALGQQRDSDGAQHNHRRQPQ